MPASNQAGAADPSVVLHDGRYFYCRSLHDGAIGIACADRLQDIGRATMQVIWRPEPGLPWSEQVWAPELQRVQGRWMVYFAASDGDNRNHRMHVLQADSDDLLGRWTFRGRIAAPTDRWAIDGIAIEHGGALCFVWSGWRDEDAGFPQVLYIAPMADACTISGERVELAAPLHDWEQRGAPLLEGPAVLQRDGQLFLSYSASASWTDDYALGLLRFTGGDLLAPANWQRSDQPLLAAAPADGVFGPGHNSFVTSPDGSEDWIVYHAIDRAGAGWAGRSVRTQRLHWTSDGLPHVGAPVPAGVLLDGPAAPEGQPGGKPAGGPRMARAADRAAPARAAGGGVTAG